MIILQPDWTGLLEAVREWSTHLESVLHGEHHWQCVARAGYELLNETGVADPMVVLLFALFHDSQRLDDGNDPEHGPRAGKIAQRLAPRYTRLSRQQLALLVRACNEHADGFTSREPTLAVCWDADRLNLWRVGIRPRPEYLSTPAARREQRIVWAEGLLEQSFEWDELYTLYSDLGTGKTE